MSTDLIPFYSRVRSGPSPPGSASLVYKVQSLQGCVRTSVADPDPCILLGSTPVFKTAIKFLAIDSPIDIL